MKRPFRVADLAQLIVWACTSGLISFYLYKGAWLAIATFSVMVLHVENFFLIACTAGLVALSPIWLVILWRSTSRLRDASVALVVASTLPGAAASIRFWCGELEENTQGDGLIFGAPSAAILGAVLVALSLTFGGRGQVPNPAVNDGKA